jgi:uridine kinase
MKNHNDEHIKKRQQTLQSIFSSSFILGGSPCSGKTTVAERLSKEFDLPYYKVDDHQMRHIKNANPKDHPRMAAYAQMEWDEIWSRPADLQMREEITFYEERFEMILEDLLEYKNNDAVVIEGAAFLPSLLHSWGVPNDKAIFLIPTKVFQIDHYSKRPWIKSILGSCKNPKQAFANWMERDHLFGQEIIKQARSFNYRCIIIDGNSSVDELYTMIKKHFGFV